MTEEEEQPALEIDASLSRNLSLNLDTRIKTPNSVASPNASRVRKRPRGGRRRSDERARFGSPRATATDAVALGIQVGHATAHVEDHDASEDLGDVGASGETDVEKAESAASLRAREAHNFTIAGTSAAALDATGAIKINAPPVVDQHYPNPFNCRGDFCDFPVQEPATLYSKAPETVSKRSGQVGLALAKRLFSKNELEAMAMKMGFNMATPQGHEDALEALGKRLEATGPGPDITKRIQHYAKPQYEHYQLPMKSIAMARKEKRGFVASMGVQGGANPSSQKRAPGADTFARPKDRGIEGLDAREHLLEQHGGVPLSHFYEHVTVCPNCYRIYSTLDQARDILEGEAMRRSRREAALRGAARDAAREDLIARLNAKGQQRRALDGREPATRERTRTPSPIRSARRYVQELPELLPNRSTPDLPTRAELREEEDRKAVELAQNLTNAVVKAVEGGACTREEAKRLQAEHESLQKFEDLESYLRGTRERKYNEAASALIAHEANPRSRRAPKSNKAGKRGGHLSLADREKEKERDARRYKGQILLAEEDDDIREQVSSILRDAEYTVTVFSDGPPALEMCRDNYFDLFLTSTLLPSLNGLEVAKLLRKREKKGDPDKQRLPLVALAAETAPEDLRLYMDAGFDGCVSKPVDEVSLLNTVRAAIPRHEPSKSAAKRLARKLGPGGSSTTATSGSADFEVPLTRPTTSGLMTSSDVVKLTLPMPRNNLDEEASSTGVFQMDADTSFPYLVMGEKRSGSRLFNIVVLHDFFDTYETMQIFFRPIVTKYPGLQVLVFNLPGQAFTEWRRDALLNNEYYDHCVDALLRHVDYNGTKELETRGPYATPFYLMGFGNGANIAMQYAARCKPPKMRALLSLNGFSHVDPHLAGILHDCMNVFSCAPATRPDLPVYFYTRFLFSSAYLSKVSTPLALNLYTAVHNPITLEGRMQICKGSLAHADLRDEIKQLDKPIILVQSSQGGLVKPLHVEPVVKLRGGEARSIRQCLKDRSRPCVIWLRSGHELFQECRRPVSDLIEQLCTGYHENHDVAFLSTADDTEAQSPGRSRRPRDSGKRGGVGGATGQPSKFFEDRFIDNVLGTLDKVRQEGSVEANPFAPNSQQQQQLQQQQQQRPGSREAKQSMQSSMDQLNESDDPAENPRAELSRWQNFREETGRRAQGPSAAERNRAAQDAKASRRKDAAAAAAASAAAAADLSFDPTMRNFDWAQKRRKGTDPDSDDEGDFDPRFGGVPARAMKPVEVPEIREYMRWRIARNKKRLAKFVRSACVIQRAWRAFLARTLAEKLRTTRAALLIQSKWRAKLARDELEQRRQEEWAARLVQRCWRGKAGRDLFRERRAQVNAARHMQRIFRGRQGKKRVEGIKQKRRRAAMAIQNMVRAHIARKLTWRLRQQRNAAIDIQRVYRGHRGRGRASLERDKYLFSKAQSQGIDFGRQMLLEHKLHGTRLQSEVSMLTREKVETEEKVEALLSEISEFDKGVRALEKEMHELSAVETEAKGVLDEEARIELREQKMRLDHEFGIMLGKIADRKERLKNLEVKLQTIDRTRQGKEEELRDLERKLVVLLEEQQQELEQIKRRQQTRGELALPETAATALQVGAGGGVGGGAALGGPMASPYAGPTPQQQQQANNMMQSTESLMKFGFMSMSLTYFSSLNMVRAMRKVGALNTVLHGPAGTGAGQAQIQALLSGANGSSAGGKAGDAKTGAGDSSGSAGSSGHFRPGFRKGQMPEEQDALTVTTWTVEDVGDWLGTLKLKQYRACFADAAIDGAFLYDLNDDDLRNTLGIEHNLHRKKILSSIVKLRRMEEAHSAQSMSNTSLSGSSLMSIQAVKNSAGGTTMNGSSGSGPAPVMPVVPSVDSMDDTDGRPISAAASLTVHPDKLLSMARHGKVREMREAMQALPDRPFDPSDVTEQYVDSYGTKYSDELGRLQWFINKADEHGNTLMTIAAQNGRIKVAKLLLDKGANVNHQNVQGQTPLHYAMAYNFYELGAWLTDAAEGASANDQLLNMYGLTPYDGLSPE
ncbi:Ankyrin repeat and protein kinase domain-containing protein 1 [Hondaea fermentalgiana]|uniref:Ankyrin repeat and protein kinase domain-containing protein 1 n=1 Tax=Hondaea fermentalgiana TaxID=2315210 RepID=A0A2R5GAI9_9STRA|nr:Ankyrin repeat and protein kinase domain-containing protein 1 [Hondaea fermentalgiana]|eukprot:GBG25573.1 Ankyrin repeat and protein kinase domain-containing protein 1 [Hondaea fermentalgiana]